MLCTRYNTIDRMSVLTTAYTNADFVKRVKYLTGNGIACDFSKCGLSPFKVCVIEGLKALAFAIVPNNWIVCVQRAFGLGTKEKK